MNFEKLINSIESTHVQLVSNIKPNGKYISVIRKIDHFEKTYKPTKC